ncbi:hypothetical protein GQ42DRAFT_156912 [Ramicandelaber brevisporus]|nr:hypothetical protein GQ42DRAFT_156912 [Ramicandelaber brevisporus]
MLEEMATIPVPTAQLPSITSLITKVNDATQQNPQNSCKQTLFTQSSTPHSSGHEFSNADGDIMNRKRIHLEQPPITPARWYEAHMGGTPAIPIASLPPPPPVPPPVPPPPSQAALVAAGAVSHHQDAEPMVIEMDDSGPTTPKVGNIDANTHGVQNMVIREHFQPNFDTQRVGDYDRNLARLDGRRVAPPDAAVLTQWSWPYYACAVTRAID